ncbi:hypothetical protein A0H81_02687 [Grifola frondosa]|uniref:Uncharacterized protein n=1 Tax=Grifola frondosa TaxID=5627 RepID=A0A1C7MM84_GRIFR|nr:hypothetical protein A0H81_02687 [Grifola frondosa]
MWRWSSISPSGRYPLEPPPTTTSSRLRSHLEDFTQLDCPEMRKTLSPNIELTFHNGFKAACYLKIFTWRTYKPRFCPCRIKVL